MTMHSNLHLTCPECPRKKVVVLSVSCPAHGYPRKILEIEKLEELLLNTLNILSKTSIESESLYHKELRARFYALQK